MTVTNTLDPTIPPAGDTLTKMGTTEKFAELTEVPPPGDGLDTVKLRMEAVLKRSAIIVDDSCVEEINLVAMGVLPKLATVACVNAVPVTVIVVSGAPAAITVGEIFERVGMGYASETAADADLLGSAWLVAVTVTLAGLGAGSGGV